MARGRVLVTMMLAGAAVATSAARAEEPAAAQSTATRTRAASRYAWLVSGGYLTDQPRSTSLGLFPPPPAQSSAAQASDDAAAAAAVALRGGPRWALAISDAKLSPEQLASDFSCAMGFTLNRETTPRTLALLLRATPDLAASTSAAKAAYNRARPFTVDGAPSCTPDQDANLRRNGSYPSGHSAIGWGWGLILAELLPSRSNEILARAREFGESRVVCNVHWQSDVDEGRIAAAAAVARLHAVPQFRTDLEAARRELAGRERSDGIKPDQRCLVEVQVLSKP